MPTNLRAMRRFIPLIVLMTWMSAAPAAQAQYYINQNELAKILSECKEDLTTLPDVRYDYRVLYNSRDNNVLARNTFYKIIGDGDVNEGQSRAKLVGLLNRTLVHMSEIGDTLIVPKTFGLDFCAYSPFPLFYPGGISFDKLFFIDKTTQAWAAYEGGRLKRWGIVNTGAESYRTPTGRFNFNWKTEYRVSSQSPPGEPWEMYWVFNFVENRGIHVHQYPMPTGGPTSHGCVRLVDEDAQWIYRWADQWTMSRDGNGYKTGFGTVAKPGTTLLVIGDDPPGNPHPFRMVNGMPELAKIELPNHPFDVPPGTTQQKYFDRIRGTSSP